MYRCLFLLVFLPLVDRKQIIKNKGKFLNPDRFDRFEIWKLTNINKLDFVQN